MKRWLLITFMVVGGLIAAGPRNPIEAASCRHESSVGHKASSGCPWQGSVIVNSDNDYWIRASDGRSVLAAHIQTQCRIQAQFTLSGHMTAFPKSVGLVSYQMEDTVAQVTFYLTSGPPSNKIVGQILAFKIAPYPVRTVKGAGSLTTKLPASGGTDVMMPAQYRFPALFFHLNNQPIDGAPAATLSCGSESGKQTKIHLANRYGSSGNPYTATQMHDSTTIEYPIPTTYKYGPKATFPEQSLLKAALKILTLEHPKYGGERFDPRTVAESQGKKRNGTATLGLTRYAIGQGNTTEMPMTRPTPCQS